MILIGRNLLRAAFDGAPGAASVLVAPGSTVIELLRPVRLEQIGVAQHL